MKNRTCTAPECDRPHLAKGYCFMHYGRLKRHGSIEDPRPGYGEKKAHPLWLRWSKLKVRGELCAEWLDFWAFANAVGAKPENAKKMRRLDDSQPFGPNNWEWAKTPTEEDNLAYLRNYYHANPDRYRDAKFQSKYGITVADYESMHDAQDGKCAICRREEGRFVRIKGTAKRKLVVDHDHETGEVRGLLCGDCNVGLGALKDNVDLLVAAASYLNFHRHQQRRKRLRVVE